MTMLRVLCISFQFLWVLSRQGLAASRDSSRLVSVERPGYCSSRLLHFMSPSTTDEGPVSPHQSLPLLLFFVTAIFVGVKWCLMSLSTFTGKTKEDMSSSGCRLIDLCSSQGFHCPSDQYFSICSFHNSYPPSKKKILKAHVTVLICS